MPGYAPASPAETTPAPTSPAALATLQLIALQRVSLTYDIDPVPNDFPTCPPAPPPDGLRSHLSHLDLAGTILDEHHQPRPTLADLHALDGVPLVVRTLEKHAPLERCILCGGSKGETYTICAGCFTTAARIAEQKMLAVLPGLREEALSNVSPLTHDQFVRAIRRTPRLQPPRGARLEPTAEAARRAAAGAVAEAARVTRLAALRALGEDPSAPPAERARRARQLRAAASAQPWSAAAWHRGLAAHALDGAWLEILARGDEEAGSTEDDDDYPVEWTEEEWDSAPDRITSIQELSPPLIPRANTAAGSPEHAEALARNTLADAWAAAMRPWTALDPDAKAYREWLARELDQYGGIPALRRSAVPQPWDSETCERWDRWVDAILGGSPAAPPEILDPLDLAECRMWGETVTTTGDGDGRAVHVPLPLPQLTSGLPSGRLRWPHFIREEIEAEFEPWGRWTEVAEAGGSVVLVWTDPEPATGPSTPRLRAAQTVERRLKRWAQGGTPAVHRPPRPKGSTGAWEREIRTERRNRRFEAMAREHAGIHLTHLERAETQND